VRPAAPEARGREPQHGIDELRPVSDAETIQVVQATSGRPADAGGSHDLVFRNSFKDIRYALETLNSSGARYEFECYDTSHLYNRIILDRRPRQSTAVHPDLLWASWRHRFASDDVCT